MKEIKITTNGRPRLELLTKNEAKVFYSTLLSYVIEYYKNNLHANGSQPKNTTSLEVLPFEAKKIKQ